MAIYNSEEYHNKAADILSQRGFKWSFKVTKKLQVDVEHMLRVVSIFRLKKVYRDFSIYLDTLKSQLDDGLPTRIYYDDSLTDELTQLKTYKNAEFVHFLCHDFIDKSTPKYHQGLFGTMVRFIPLIEIEPLNYHIYVTDCDLITAPSLYKNFKLSPVDISIGIRTNVRDIDAIRIPCKLKYSYLGGMIYAKKQVSPKIFIDFLFDIKSSKPYIWDWVNNVKLYNKKKYINPRFDIPYQFIYGIDEYFINCFYMRECYENKFKILGIYPNIYLQFTVYNLYKYLEKNPSEIEKYSKLISDIYKILPETKKLKGLEVISYIDNLMYKSKNYIEELKIDILKIFCKHMVINEKDSDVVCAIKSSIVLIEEI